jgi:hypothetical protein
LPVGFYQVRVEAPGFKALVTFNVKVDVAARTTVDFRLQVRAVTESMVVTASAVQMQMQTAQIGRTVESKQITDLALNGRNPSI